MRHNTATHAFSVKRHINLRWSALEEKSHILPFSISTPSTQILNPQSKLLYIRGGVGLDWTDIALHSHLSSIGKTLHLGPHVILADCVRRGHSIPSAQKDNKASPEPRQPKRESKFGYDVFFTIHSVQDDNTWYGLRERIRNDISSRCNSDDNSIWTNEGGHHHNILGMCPAIWKCTAQLCFEIYSTVFNFQSESFLSTYCYPHPARGDDKSVTLLTITNMTPHDPHYNPVLQCISVPTVEDVLESFAEHYTITDIDIMYSLYPASKFSPTKCMYGNQDMQSNSKHRYVVLWRDGVERLLPDKVRTTEALFTLTASSDGQHHLPGFWTTEHSTTRSKYYNGLLKSLYNAHDTHAQQTSHKAHPPLLRGLQPSTRWYQYAQQQHLRAPTSTASPAGRGLGGGLPRNPPGRGHPHLPRPWAPTSTTSSSTTLETQAGSTNGIQQLLQQLVSIGQDQRADMATLTRQVCNEQATQNQINTDLQNNLAQLSADIAALRQSQHK